MNDRLDRTNAWRTVRRIVPIRATPARSNRSCASRASSGTACWNSRQITALPSSLRWWHPAERVRWRPVDAAECTVVENVSRMRASHSLHRSGYRD